MVAGGCSVSGAISVVVTIGSARSLRTSDTCAAHEPIANVATSAIAGMGASRHAPGRAARSTPEPYRWQRPGWPRCNTICAASECPPGTLHGVSTLETVVRPGQVDKRVFTDEQIEQFVDRGYLHLESAIPLGVAAQCRVRLWAETGCDPDDAGTWTRPVIRIGGLTDGPFQEAASTDRLHAAFDQLVGPHRWLPRVGLGTFPIRFPHPEPPGDDGWHVDAGWHRAEDDPEFDWSAYADLPLEGYRLNLASRGRALLMLFLFSDVGPNDAPTRISVGSHLLMPRHLAPHGDAGTSTADLPSIDDLPVAEAIGSAGDVYLCHPFLIHAAQSHRGTEPKFMAQPPLCPVGGQLDLDDPVARATPIVRAIVRGLSGRHL